MSKKIDLASLVNIDLKAAKDAGEFTMVMRVEHAEALLRLAERTVKVHQTVKAWNEDLEDVNMNRRSAHFDAVKGYEAALTPFLPSEPT